MFYNTQSESLNQMGYLPANAVHSPSVTMPHFKRRKDGINPKDIRAYWNVDNVARPSPFIIDHGWLEFARRTIEDSKVTGSNAFILHLPWSSMRSSTDLPQYGTSIMRPAGYPWVSMNYGLWGKYSDYNEFLEACELWTNKMDLFVIYEGSLHSQSGTIHENAERLAKHYNHPVFKKSNFLLFLDQAGLMHVPYVYELRRKPWEKKYDQENADLTLAYRYLFECGIIDGGELAMNIGHPYVGDVDWWLFCLNTVYFNSFSNWGYHPERQTPQQPRIAFFFNGLNNTDNRGQTAVEGLQACRDRGWGLAFNVREFKTKGVTWNEILEGKINEQST